MNGDEFQLSCPLPISDHPEIQLAHGGGGAMTQQLIERLIVPAFDNPILALLHDGANIEIDGTPLAFTTDSYVVKPLCFPGGDIGSLAVNGTVNDLLMCGARPLYLSVGLILEEGLPIATLETIIASMGEAARRAGVQLVTGDTKVVGRGSGDGIFINTAGVGLRQASAAPCPERVRIGDSVLISGDVGRHGMAVMGAREALDFGNGFESDCYALTDPVAALYAAGIDLHCLRDPTRGGLATTLVEIAEAACMVIEIEESRVPVCDGVRGACEILGLDPLYVANEGCCILFVEPRQEAEALAVLHRFPACASASHIGSVSRSGAPMVLANTAIGGQRILDRLSGEQLPRIC